MTKPSWVCFERELTVEDSTGQGQWLTQSQLVNRMCGPRVMTLLFIYTLVSQTEWKRDELASSINIEGRQFIAAFELSEDNGFVLSWPFESMQSAPYERVIVVVEKMPRIRDRTAGNESIVLSAAQCLRINGRRQKPYRHTNGQTHFLVKLENGRLCVSVLIPVGKALDPDNKVARIKLYRPDNKRRIS